VHWCRRRVKFNEVPEKVPEKVWEALQGSGEGSGEGLGSFGAEPGQVQLWCRARSGSTGVRRRFQRRTDPSLVRFNKVPEKVPEKV